MIQISHLERDLEAIRHSSPLVHNITNFVVMNNTANALLAIGASPVMAHSLEEVSEMAALASALVLNIGTLEPDWVEAMIRAGRTASEKGTPIVLDPVGAGATTYRTEVCKRVISECKPTLIRGNASEIMALSHSGIVTKGVDSTAASNDAIEAATQLASTTGAVVVISGPVDYITDGNQIIETHNGAPIMTRVTGMGCTATALVGAFAAVNPNPLEAAAHAMAAMGITGEIAAQRSAGNGSMQINFLDELYNLNGETLRKTFRQS